MSAPRHAVGVDLGGTKIATVMIDPSGGITSRRHLRHAIDGYDDAVGAIVEAVEECLVDHGRSDVCGVGVALAAWLSADRRRVLRAANLGFSNAELGEELARRLALPVQVGNDGDMAALAEGRYGAARRHDTFAVLTLGTGLGGGVVAGRRLLVGSHGLAGELGHVPAPPEGPSAGADSAESCACGGTRCLETVASGSAVSRRALAAGMRGPRGGAPSAEEVARASGRGDPVASSVLTAVGYVLGRAVAGWSPAIDPSDVLLGGGLVAGAPVLLPVATAAGYAAAAGLTALHQGPRFGVTHHGPEAAALGAASVMFHGAELPPSV